MKLIKSSKQPLNSEDISIRRAEASDYEGVSILEEMIFDLHRRERPDYFKDLDQSYFREEFEGLLAQPDAIAFVAVCGQTIAGICL